MNILHLEIQYDISREMLAYMVSYTSLPNRPRTNGVYSTLSPRIFSFPRRKNTKILFKIGKSVLPRVRLAFGSWLTSRPALSALKISRTERTHNIFTTSKHQFISDMNPPTKKQKVDEDDHINKMKIATHSGTFHADESLAVYMLRLLPEYKDAELVRSRDPEVLEQCDIIVDVTGKYDGKKYFDHHQREFNDTFGEGYATRLSSAGLVYKHFGKRVIAQILDVPVEEDVVETLYTKVYTEFIEAVDANDNGISAYPDSAAPQFRTNGITLPSMVSVLNPLWTDPREKDDAYIDERFLTASALMGTAFQNLVLSYGKGWYPAKSAVQKAFEDRHKYDDQGRIVLFETFVPWKEHLYNVETAADKSGEVLYVLYSDGKGWRVQAVAASGHSFQSRKALPEPWRGARDAALDKITGVEGGVFVHASGFIGGHKTREGALQLAKLALDF